MSCLFINNSYTSPQCKTASGNKTINPEYIGEEKRQETIFSSQTITRIEAIHSNISKGSLWSFLLQKGTE